MTTDTENLPESTTLESVVIRFAGDSGDGMQLAGNRFSAASALFGNDLATLPNFPAEIRAPAGTVAGVSAFQVHIADWDILTPGDHPDCLVAMNPAALKANFDELNPGALIIANSDAFDERNLEKAGYESNPLEDGSLDAFHVLTAPMEQLTKEALVGTGVTGRSVLRSKNFFALGLVSWMYQRPTDQIESWVNHKFGKDSPVAKANIAALRAGYNYGITTEEFHHTYHVEPASLPPGEYTSVSGSQAIAWGLIAGAKAAGLDLFLGAYPITPASPVLELLARQRHFGVKTFQAEDEIAAIGAAVGASFAGRLGATVTSGPGLALKTETLALAFIQELPLVVIDVQRAGPSTGMPTRTEQSDLLFAMYGRPGETPLPVIAALTPSDAFATAMEAVRIATKYMTPVVVLSDAYIANSSEPWRLPDFESLPTFPVNFATEPNEGDEFLPYVRDEITGARPWAAPGTPGLEHRVGGLEKEHRTGNVSYDSENHALMTKLRAAKVEAIAADIPPVEVYGDEDAELLVLGWGSTFGAIRAAVMRVREDGIKAAHVQLKHINPFPPNLEAVLEGREKILIPELNSGHLTTLIRARHLLEPEPFTKVEGDPFKAVEIEDKIRLVAKEVEG